VPGDDTYLGVLADGCHRSWYRWNELLYPPDCIGILPKFKPLFVESFFPDTFWAFPLGQRQGGLEIPTETVVY
jgi:hypothetical protein